MGEIGNNINNHIDNKISQKPVKKQRISFRCGLERTPSKDSFTRTEDNKTSEMRTSIGGKLLSSFYPQRPEPEKNSPPKNLIADDPEFKLAQQKMTIISQQDEIEDLKAQLEAERAKTAAQASRLEEQQAEIKSVTDALEEAIEKGTDESLESKFTAQFQQIADDAVSSYAFVLPQDSIIKQNLINKKVYKIGAITPFEPISTEYLPPINTAELKKEFAETGNVDIKIPESYDTKPVKADNAYIGDSNPDNLNKTISSKMTVEYGKRINWSNQKIARDMLQNFYDGHGNTLDGVEISAEKQPDGKTKIKISGKALYDFEKLQDFGSGNKIENPYNAGGFGEGSRILVANLIGKKEAETITYSSADWRLTFCEKEGKIHETLTKADEPIDGNTLEFETDNDDFVKALIDSVNYFGHGQNPDYDNLSYISRDFAFKILDEDEKGNLYLTQRFEYERDGNWDDTLDNLTLIFKRKPDAKKYKELTGETLKIDRDRMSFSNEDLENLTYYFAHYSGMKDDDIIKTIISTKPLWHKITYEAKDSPLLSFVRGMLKEASSRNLAIDTQDEKIVYHQPSYNDAFVNSILEKYGYLILDGDFSDVKLLSSLEAFKKLSEHKALEPTDAEKKRIKLLDEGVRIVYDSIKKTLINHLKNGPEIKLNLDINDKETIGIFLNNNKFSNKILGEDGYEYWNSFKESSYEFSETTLDKMNDAERSQLVSKIKEGINKNLKEMGETGKIDYDFISELVSKIRVAQYDKKDFIQDIAINEYLVTLQDLCIIREEDISRPKYIFDRHSEVKKDTLGEAIIEYSRYNGHWVDREYLNTADFQQLLGTWIHEICHKSGGDGTTDFTYALTDMLRVLLRSGANLQNAMKLAAIEKVFNKIQD